MASWTNQMTAPPILIRSLYLIAVMIAPLFSKAYFLPAALSCLFVVSTNGFSYSYLPSTISIYSALLLVFVLIKHGNRSIVLSKIPKIIIALSIFVLFVDLFNNGAITQLFHCLFVLAMFSLILDLDYKNTNREEIIKTFATFFSFASLVLSFFFYSYGFLFTNDYGSTSGLERTGWMDANYFSSTLGMFVISSLTVLMSDIKKNLIEIILYVLTIWANLYVMVSCASRGAILALGVGVGFLILFSKVKLKYKIFILIFLAASIIFLFNNGYFELLEYRIQNDDGSGSGRLDIWKNKLTLFYQEDNILYYLFGMGFYKGTHLGEILGRYFCFHNDYISYLVCYGIVGLILFFIFLFSPLWRVSKHSHYRPAVIGSIMYLAVCCITLNPLSEGYLAYFCFYCFINQLCQDKNTT